MIRLAPRTREDMEAAHSRVTAKKRAITQKTAPKSQRPWNMDTVLEIGQIVYFTFRGRPYGMPPLPWPAAQRLLSAWLTAVEFSVLDSPDKVDQYFTALGKLPPLLWKNCFSASPLDRVLRRIPFIGRFLIPNPWANATEDEIVEWTNFFLARRMRSGGSVPNLQAQLLAGTH